MGQHQNNIGYTSRDCWVPEENQKCSLIRNGQKPVADPEGGDKHLSKYYLYSMQCGAIAYQLKIQKSNCLRPKLQFLAGG